MVRASLRDASWYRNPSTHRPVRYHIVKDDHSGIGACGITVVHLGPDDLSSGTADALTVPLALRCMRPGCKSRWPLPEPPKEETT